MARAENFKYQRQKRLDSFRMFSLFFCTNETSRIETQNKIVKIVHSTTFKFEMNLARNTKVIFESIFKYKRKLKFVYETNIRRKCVERNQRDNLKVLFFGTDKFSVPSLKALVGEYRLNGSVSQLGLVTSFKSSSNPVRKYAGAENLNCFDWPVSTEICKMYDLGVVVSFGHLIPESIIASFPYGMINVHASLLPRWRGAAPIIYALMNGDTKTGVTIMRILPKHFDIGQVIYNCVTVILAQKEILISNECLMPELHETLSNEGASLLVDCLHNIESKIVNAREQDLHLVTYAPKVTAALAQVNWNSSAVQVYNLYRALYSFKPLTTHWNSLLVRIVEMILSTTDATNDKPPGTVEYVKLNKCLKVTCGNGSSVRVMKLGLEGKKVMTAAEFYNGFLNKFPEKCYFS
ncbi:Methionyl-tRNA formyltransferase, mitochondrial [Pseudolycoriella hygida]|uniref:Methionyl-tRNA formyltransferase, mitochondrial n=1 Tax=Pseudolycoriella hygida TaxID=35572 RepID=A0A9Q0RZS4_9DIPT|nr:Methionyl-tRNA formyltransferase, mitochondrial [Pseudolycoriella hygida]